MAKDVELKVHILRRAGLSLEFSRVETKGAFIEQLEYFSPDIVIVDYQLPQFDGMPAIAVDRERAPHVPIIVHKGLVDEETAAACIKAGAVNGCRRAVVRWHCA